MTEPDEQAPYRVVEDFPHAVTTVDNLRIPLPDGGWLAARLWLPEDAEQQPVPALIEYIPYRQRDITRDRDAVNHPYLAGHGYACLRIDLRGSGDSSGVMADQYREQEQADGEAAIAWVAEQPWCTGAVGLFGISWGGFNALQLAARRPPALKAIMAACATDDLYVDNMHYMGGCLLSDNLSEATTMFAFNATPPDPAGVGEQWRELWQQRLEHSGHWLSEWLHHQRRDDYWRWGSVCEDYQAIACPVFAVSGWADGYTNAVFRLLEHLDVPRKGLVGPWGHKYPHLGIPGPAVGFLQEMRRWFDYWLKDDDNGVMDEPMVRVWQQDSVGPDAFYHHRPGRWIAEEQWPSPQIDTQTWPLDGHRRLLTPEQPADPDAPNTLSLQSPLTVGLFAGKWCSYAATPDLPHDQRQEDGGALVFDSEPLTQALAVVGAATLHLTVSADQPVAQVAVRLSDVQPDGSATRVTYGLLNLCHRDGHGQPQPLVPGETYQVTVALNHIAQEFAAGHRIRVAISSSYWPLIWPSPKPVRLTVHPAKSRMLLPVRAPRDEDATLPPLGPPEGAPPLAITPLKQGEHNWRVHRDLASDRSELEVIDDGGCWRLPDTGTEICDERREWYRLQDNDVLSVEGETYTRRHLRRDDWDACTITRTRLRATATAFILTAQLDAYCGDERIFSKNYRQQVPRDHL